MKKLSTNHTTILLMLSDGTHRYCNAQWEMSNKECWNFVRETIKCIDKDVYINEMMLACGVQSLRYTRNEVLEIAAKV